LATLTARLTGESEIGHSGTHKTRLWVRAGADGIGESRGSLPGSARLEQALLGGPQLREGVSQAG
jgi:hypothetical protein